MGRFSNFIRYFLPSSGFTAADRAQLQDASLPRFPMPQAASREYKKPVRENVQGLCKYFYRNDAPVRNSVDCLAMYATGLRVQPLSGDMKFNDLAASLFSRFWRHPDISGRWTGWEVEAIISSQLDISGEIFLLKTLTEKGKPALQLIESWQLAPAGENDCGIDFDAWGKPARYHFRTVDDSEITVDAARVIACQNLPFPSSLRGEPCIQPGIDLNTDRKHLQELVMTKAQNENRILNKLTQTESSADDNLQDEYDRPSYNIMPDGEEQQPADPAENIMQTEGAMNCAARRISEAIGGDTVALPAGFDLTQNLNNTPGSTYKDYQESLLLQGQLGCGMPYGFIAPSGNGTGNRIIMQHAARITERRALKIQDCMSRIYCWFIGWHVTKGTFQAAGVDVPDDFLDHDWQTPRSISIDARQDKVDAELAANGSLPIADYYSERGYNWEDEVKARCQQLLKITEICGEYGVAPAAAYPLLFSSASGAAGSASKIDATETPNTELKWKS